MKQGYNTKEESTYNFLEWKEGNLMECYLDFFLFQIYTGLGYSDAQQFNFETDVIYKYNQPHLRLKVQRTNKEYLKPLRAEALEILERNNYKLHVCSNQKFN